ncbi:hypothetical protein [Shewanella algidipiscicola]|uniref:hypothetical protein n=1 Tax=Shewanella algidipiscicola TaxID=614070 RepID=UPI000D788674|nr:hypothetical protein [Shewanella algidipiscicola]
MISEALLLASAWLWVPMSHGQALVCHTPELVQCLAQLPRDARQQLPPKRELLKELGHRGAMAKPIDHPAITGVVLLNPDNIPRLSSARWSGKLYSLALDNAVQMTLWHELGHLAVTSSASALLTQYPLSGYQHEWLADTYLVWSLAQQGQGRHLAWQQYHKRNLAVFDNVIALSHWSAPMLVQLLHSYSWQELGQFEDFDHLIDEIYPTLQQYQIDELNEFASLLHYLFGQGVNHRLPHYMFWRRAQMADVIRPTLEHLMGKAQALAWLDEQTMSGD